MPSIKMLYLIEDVCFIKYCILYFCTCVAELALLLLLLAIETATSGGGGGGSGGSSGRPIDTSRPARGKGEPGLRRSVLRRRFSHVLAGALGDDAPRKGGGARW